MVMVNRHQDVDKIIDQRRQEDLAVENNLTTIVERIMARNGMGATLQRPLYASPLAEFILQAEAPRGMKVPKYTKFGGEPELSSIKRRFTESIDDYLNRFRSLKARCFTQVPEHELVQMAAGGLNYSIRKKIDPTFVKNMSQLADRVRHLERLRLEKVRHNKSKKEKVAFIEYDATDPIHEADYASSTELEIDVAELKSGSAYECHSLLPAQGKNPVENNPKFPAKTYTFDVSKCEEIFDLLVKDGQMVVPPSTKIPPLEQRQKIGEYDEANMLEQTGESPDVDIAGVYPRADEDLVDFLYHCKNKGSQVCLCAKCGAVTDKIAAENF
ncbi:uncharacterized protein LOC127079836 [Lathyrus oleraceus]|uniref:uncharacterized protein LOC127079836 n=1 Tax=Pisum sativum TaxID=3888 RepID=UPI0021CF02B2|nr:uncharacterized protein LOC127079836 [Pisum sativum]